MRNLTHPWLSFLLVSLVFITTPTMKAQSSPSLSNSSYIFTYGGEIKKEYIRFLAKLTGKEKPKVGFFPTGTADNPQIINHFYYLCSDLTIEPRVIYTWVSSDYCKQSFDDMILDLDVIIIGGGNTLNMVAIWKAQGIDSILRKAQEKGIILAGGSAGSICWFSAGISDSRPKTLSIVNGLGFLNYSHCPHYSNEPSRKQLYQDLMKNNSIGPGYACDELSGVLFKNGIFDKSYSLDSNSHSYYISVENGRIKETRLKQELLK